MSASNILSIRFIIKKDKAKDNRAPVYARVVIDRKSSDISLKRDINIDSWNPDTGRAKGKSVEDRAFNNFLDQVRADLTNTFAELKFQKKFLTSEMVKNQFCGIVSQGQTLNYLVHYHNTHLKHTIEWGTMKNYHTTQNYIQMFIRENYKAADLPLSRLSYTFLVDFEIFLRQHKPKDHHNLDDLAKHKVYCLDLGTDYQPCTNEACTQHHTTFSIEYRQRSNQSSRENNRQLD